MGEVNEIREEEEQDLNCRAAISRVPCDMVIKTPIRALSLVRVAMAHGTAPCPWPMAHMATTDQPTRAPAHRRTTAQLAHQLCAHFGGIVAAPSGAHERGT